MKCLPKFATSGLSVTYTRSAKCPYLSFHFSLEAFIRAPFQLLFFTPSSQYPESGQSGTKQLKSRRNGGRYDIAGKLSQGVVKGVRARLLLAARGEVEGIIRIRRSRGTRPIVKGLQLCKRRCICQRCA